MRVGICYNIDYRPEVHGSPEVYLDTILCQVDLLEELGYDTVWFSEHHCSGYSFGNPAVIAAAAAQRTKRIRIGTGVSLVPLHHPIFLAEQYGLLDVLSSGRLEYGVGRGYLMYEYDWLKIAPSESHERYHEAMDFVVKAWTSDGAIDFHGKYFHVDGYNYFPKPVQRPFPPIYASGGGTADSYRWAGEMGFHLGTALFMPDRDFTRNSIKLYRDTLVKHGHDRSMREVCGITQMFCAKDQETAVDKGARFANNYYRFFSELPERAGRKSEPNNFYATADAREMNKEDLVFLGTPENLVERINRAGEDLGMDLLLLEVAQGGAAPQDVEETLELFGREVLPHVQSRQPVVKVGAAG